MPQMPKTSRGPMPDLATAEVMNQFLDRLGAAGIAGLQKQYIELKAYVPPNNAAIAFDANKAKNRYTDQPCYDHTRVKLTYNTPPEEDYIHANWVEMPGLGNRFICAQGPMPNTINDFWRMSCCQTEEGGKPKCTQYWPLKPEETKAYGTVTVKNLDVCEQDKAFVVVRLEVSIAGQVPLQTELFKWRDWPDKHVPKSGLGVLRLLRFIRDKKDSVAVVHCSAGVGRTGTVVAIAMAMAKIYEKQAFVMYDLVKELRGMRHNAVQAEVQYLYVYKTVCEYIHAKGLQRPTLAQFSAEYDTYVKSVVPPTI
ncbi:tyrosine phosphatase [Aphelenchoides avenae]|nr:tyrosine phosphatase [Aphelenchus avenae]